MTNLQKFMNDEDGQGLVEYALILALIAIVSIAAVRLLGTSVSAKMGEVQTGVNGI